MPRKSSVEAAFAPSSGTRIRPPDDLTGDARGLFVDTVLSVRAGHFENSDIPMLCIYCRAILLEKKASAGLANDGYVTDEGRPSGWLPVYAHATRTVSTYSGKLRLGPTSRAVAPSSDTEPPATPNAYEKMCLLERQREPN